MFKVHLCLKSMQSEDVVLSSCSADSMKGTGCSGPPHAALRATTL